MTSRVPKTMLFALASLLGAGLLMLQPAARGQLPEGATPGALFWLATLFIAALAVQSVRLLAALDGRRWVGMATAALFGLWIVYFWQLLVVAFAVPRVLLPPPLLIVAALGEHGELLWGDFAQTVLKAVLIGWGLGCGLGFAVAVAIDRQPFLQRGLLPLASLTSTIPLVAVAPIAVMWFGFEWPSKAAVVVLMTQLRRQLPTHAAGAAFAGRHAVYLWRAQGQRHAGADWSHRG